MRGIVATKNADQGQQTYVMWPLHVLVAIVGLCKGADKRGWSHMCRGAGTRRLFYDGAQLSKFLEYIASNYIQCKTPSDGYRHPYHKPKTVWGFRLRFMMGIPIPIKRSLLSE